MMDWRLRNDIWELVSGGMVLETLRHDPESGQYRDGRGTLLGKQWSEAKEACEKRFKAKAKGTPNA